MKFIRNYSLHMRHAAAAQNNLQLASWLKTAPTAKILDLGCSNGVIAHDRFMKRILYPDIYGIEIDALEAQKARKLGLKVKVTNTYKRFPFSNNYFDIVSANQLIEHLHDPDHFLDEIFRALRPAGYLLLATENLASWYNIAALFMGWHPFSLHTSTVRDVGNPFRLGTSEETPSYSRHVKVFTLRSLTETVRLHGFEVEQHFGAGYYPFPNHIANYFAQLDSNHVVFIGFRSRKKE